MTRRDARRELAELDRVFSGLAHATRRQILLILHLHGGEMTAGEIAARFQCSWPTTSRHLGRLVEAGLITVHARGRGRIYSLERAALLRVAGGWIEHFAHAAPGIRR